MSHKGTKGKSRSNWREKFDLEGTSGVGSIGKSVSQLPKAIGGRPELAGGSWKGYCGHRFHDPNGLEARAPLVAAPPRWVHSWLNYTVPV